MEGVSRECHNGEAEIGVRAGHVSKKNLMQVCKLYFLMKK
jgi:hypothetical protein